MTVSSYFFYFHSLICKTAFLLSHLKAGFYCVPDTHIHACVLSCLVVPDSLRPYILQSPRFLCPWNFSGQGYWSGLPFPSSEDLPKPGIEPWSPALQANSLLSESESEVAQSCLTLFDPMDSNLPGSAVHGILQARIRE